MPSPERPDRSRQPDESPPESDRGRQPAARESSSSSQGDFGSFVSSSVRDSFQRLKRASQPAEPEPDATVASASRRRRSRPDADQPERPDGDRRVRSLGGPVGRKWRDTAPGAGGRVTREPAEPEPLTGESPATEPPRFDVNAWARETFFDENGPTRRLFIAIAVIVVIILLIIFLLVRGAGNDGSNTPTPTETTTTVLTTDRTATPSRRTPTTTQEATEPAPGPGRQTAEPTATTGVQVGGDNQRD